MTIWSECEKLNSCLFTLSCYWSVPEERHLLSNLQINFSLFNMLAILIWKVRFGNNQTSCKKYSWNFVKGIFKELILVISSMYDAGNTAMLLGLFAECF